MRTLLRLCAVSMLSVSPTRALAAPTFVEVAREFRDGLMWLNSDVLPALADDGTVVFVGSRVYEEHHGAVLFSGDGSAALHARDLSASGLSNLRSLDVNAEGQLVFVADRVAELVRRGVYTTNTSGAPVGTLHEAPYTPGEGPSDFVVSNVALSPNGTVAFATIVLGSGAIYRGPATGPVTALRTGSGVFYNVRELDVNDAGQVAVQMEYTDRTAGLSRAILLFDAPEQTLDDLDTAIERLSTSVQPMPAINASGQVAFALNTSVTLLYFDPPGVFSSTPARTIALAPGVYVATPTPWGEPNEITQYASAAGAYASFGRVDINDAGLVAFQATLDSGGFGVFTGPSPSLHKVLAAGDMVGSQRIAWVGLSELNNEGELTLVTTDFASADRQVWRVGNLPRPLTLARPRAWPWPWLDPAPCRIPCAPRRWLP